MTIITHIKASVMPWLNRLLRRQSSTYRMIQRERADSLARRQQNFMERELRRRGEVSR